MFALKDYQEKALGTLDGFFRKLNSSGLDAAWHACAPMHERHGYTRQTEYDTSALGEVPAVCIRIPTGGGKTFIAAHAVARAGRLLKQTEAPVALWLVPSDAIRSQTLAALSAPRNPCREALTEHFGERVRVCALDELATIGPQEVGSSAIIIVATIQSFNVKDKSIRTVYSFDETLAPHFQTLTPQQIANLGRVTEADIAAQPYLTAADLGRVKTSLANWLTLHRPIVVVDEAHNNRTEQAFRTLRELQPACVIEMTATPMPDCNVLFHVSAQALANEDMIKLPIVLVEHSNGWKDAVRDAILTRDRIELLAAREPDYIRPILLFQAEDVNGEANVSTLLAHLTSADGEKIDAKQIAVVTGEQKDLDGVVLGEPTCPIRFVITVKALKEGWDCPFAYVLCSLQSMKSGKDVEQLLGRVLRMPYARARQQGELGKAYAHVVSSATVRAADALIDGLIANMGFERYEALTAVVPAQAAFAMPDDCATQGMRPVESIFSIPVMPNQPIPDTLRPAIELRPTSVGATVIVRGGLTAEVEDFLLTGSRPGKQQQAVREAIDRERIRQAGQHAPATRGVPFAPLPQMCMQWDGEWQPVERQVLAELGEFDLFAERVSLAGFAIRENGNAFEIDIAGERVVYSATEVSQLHLNEVPAHASEHDLVRHLDRSCRQPDIGQPMLLKWLLAVVRHLMGDRGISLTALVRGKYQLADAMRREIDRRREKAIASGFQKALPGFVAAPVLEERFVYTFNFHPNQYAARPPFYSGRYQFKRHYYPNIHDLQERRKDGALSEEFLCAQAIDLHPAMKHWVRNVESNERFSFWMPIASGYFYPDFVAELQDGRVLVIEYKGGHLLDTPETKMKQQIGDQWERSSGERCLFLMAVAQDQDEQRRDIRKQIDDKVCTGSFSEPVVR